jgi:hypothetical protein
MEEDEIEVFETVRVVVAETEDGDAHFIIGAELAPSCPTEIDGLIPEEMFSLINKRKNVQIVKNPMHEFIRLGPNLNREDVPMTISLCGATYGPAIIAHVSNFHLPVEFLDTLKMLLLCEKKVKTIEPKCVKNTE